MSEELRDRNAAWYATMLNAFVSSRREKDKSLLALSTAAIGLLITLATTVGIPSIPIAMLYTVAIAAFLAAIFTAIQLFDRDAEHVESLLRELHDDDAEMKLKASDRRLLAAFTTGVVMSIVIGGAYAWSKVQRMEEVAMARPTETGQAPDAPEKRSLQGVANLKPENLPRPIQATTAADHQPAPLPAQSDAETDGSSAVGDSTKPVTNGPG